MNPQLLQSIQMMALPLQELKFRIQEELERNPALEVVEDNSEDSLESNEDAKAEEYDFFENSSDPGRPLDQEASDRKQKFMEGALSRPESLHDHLMWQLRLHPLREIEFEIGELLIQNLDDNGFHIEEPETLVKPDDITFLPKLIDLIRTIQNCNLSLDHSEAVFFPEVSRPGIFALEPLEDIRVELLCRMIAHFFHSFVHCGDFENNGNIPSGLHWYV